MVVKSYIHKIWIYSLAISINRGAGELEIIDVKALLPSLAGAGLTDVNTLGYVKGTISLTERE